MPLSSSVFVLADDDDDFVFQICCLNHAYDVVEPKISSSSRLTDANRFGNPQGSFGDQNQYPYYSNFNNDKQNKDNSGTNNDGYVNLLINNQWGQNQNIRSPIEPSRFSSTNKNKYWNERPDKNKWDIGNQNFYHGNNHGPRGSNNNRRNYYNNDQAGVNNNDNNQGQGQPEDSSNNYDADGTQNDSNYPYYPNSKLPGKYFSFTNRNFK